MAFVNGTDETYAQLQQKLNDPMQCATAQGIQEVIQLNQQLVFNYNPADMDSAALAECNKTKQAVDTVHALIEQFIHLQDYQEELPSYQIWSHGKGSPRNAPGCSIAECVHFF